MRSSQAGRSTSWSTTPGWASERTGRSAGQAPLDIDDLQSTRDYDGVEAYRRSKLALICFTFDLAEETRIAVNALHPGTFLDTGMVRQSGIRPLGPASHGADSIIRLIDRSLEGISGRYFDQMEPARPDPQALDRNFRQLLRERTDDLLAPFL